MNTKEQEKLGNDIKALAAEVEALTASYKAAEGLGAAPGYLQVLQLSTKKSKLHGLVATAQLAILRDGATLAALGFDSDEHLWGFVDCALA